MFKKLFLVLFIVLIPNTTAFAYNWYWNPCSWNCWCWNPCCPIVVKPTPTPIPTETPTIEPTPTITFTPVPTPTPTFIVEIIPDPFQREDLLAVEGY